MKRLFLIALVIISSSHALEIDEKLTIRVLDVSVTKKTVLTNRGIEDGLMVGDHAKFFLTTGVVGRGVVVRASPSRSIWSLYRLIDKDAILKDKVMKLKISSPIKVTEDPTKMLESEDQSEAPVVMQSPEEASELASLKRVSPKRKKRSNGKLEKSLWELWGMGHLSALTAKVTRGVYNGAAPSGSLIDLSAGVGRYVSGDATGFMSHISVDAFGRIMNFMPGGNDGESSAYELGVGLNYHLGSTAMTNTPIWYGYGQGGIALSTKMTVTDATAQNIVGDPVAGNGFFWALGIGMKYFMDSGFGLRASVEYYNRTETYNVETGGSAWQSTLGGFRGNVGLSYRF